MIFSGQFIVHPYGTSVHSITSNPRVKTLRYYIGRSYGANIDADLSAITKCHFFSEFFIQKKLDTLNDGGTWYLVHYTSYSDFSPIYPNSPFLPLSF
jgi:hypothetical protein